MQCDDKPTMRRKPFDFVAVSGFVLSQDPACGDSPIDASMIINAFSIAKLVAGTADESREERDHTTNEVL
jgi:hypothetical protein